MLKIKYKTKLSLKTLIFISATLATSLANATIISWVDWISETPSPTATTINGELTTTTSLVDVTYTNQQGIAFLQTGTGIDYFENSQTVAESPFTSATVENIPTAAEMIALRYAGSQNLMFSESIANIVFSYVSLNSNGYSFDQDFDILSVGGENGKSCGYWGCGTSTKSVIDLGGGNFEYQLLGTGEPHGTIQFKGAFDSVTWTSLSSENWNGFTIGIEGTAAEVFPTTNVPEPSSIALIGLALIALFTKKNRLKV